MATINDELAPIATPSGEGVGLREPGERLDPRALTLWRIREIITTIVLTLLVAGATYWLHRWQDIALGWVIAATGATLVLYGAWVFIQPSIAWRTWRYEIREDEVDLLHGVIVRSRQIIPMGRIQHVDTSRGPLQRKFGLASVTFHTASGVMVIPELSNERAAEVRDLIAERASVHDDL